jgi:type II secretory pathway predicted ATPase ExeA
MYERFYGLSGKPFSLLPDADFLYPSKRHRMALNLLEYGLETQAGFTVITGEVGAGKTTIIRRFLRGAGKDLTVGVITNTDKGFGRLLNSVALAFDFDPAEAGSDYTKLYHRFVDFLVAQYAAGKRAILVVDEAQNFSVETLEELRMLSNVNNEKDQLLQTILLGQPELLEMLKRPELRQFVQRIAVHYHLEALDAGETSAYIKHRLNVVGGRPELFDEEACAAVHYFASGVPRLINLLCDFALVYGFSVDLKTIDFDTVFDVVRDRSRSGLTPFRAVPDGVDRKTVRSEITSLSRLIA